MTPEAEAFLRRRRRFHILFLSLSGLLVISIGISQVRAIGHPRDDWYHFNHRQFQVSAVLSADRLQILAPSGTSTTVHLTGIDLPENDEGRADAARDYVARRILGSSITILLDTPQTRDDDGQLLAYVFPSDGDNLNADLVAEGLARPDPHNPSPLASQIQAAESEARKKGRGLASPSTKSSTRGTNQASKPNAK